MSIRRKFSWRFSTALLAAVLMTASGLSADAVAGHRDRGNRHREDWRGKPRIERRESDHRRQDDRRWKHRRHHDGASWFRHEHRRPYRAHRVIVYGEPYYYHAGFGLYLGGLALGVRLGNAMPAGYVLYDPYCERRFYSLRAVERHMARCGHERCVSLVQAGDFHEYYEDGY